MGESEELEMLADRKSARRFYQKMLRLKEGYKTGPNSCKNENGDLVTDIRSILKLWREHFSTLLNGDGRGNNGEYDEAGSPINDDGIDVPVPDDGEIPIAIALLKNNEAAGSASFPVELFIIMTATVCLLIGI